MGTEGRAGTRESMWFYVLSRPISIYPNPVTVAWETAMRREARRKTISGELFGNGIESLFAIGAGGFGWRGMIESR